MNIKEEIVNLLKNRQSFFLIGLGNSGKTWFVKNELLPFLQNVGFSVVYIADCDQLPEDNPRYNCVIVDEVEVLQDRDYLEAIHLDKQPYYSDEYIYKVKVWFDKLRKIQIPCVYVITRSSRDDIKNFIETVHKTDWDERTVEVVEFHRE